MIQTKKELKELIQNLVQLHISVIYKGNTITDNILEAYELWYNNGNDTYKHSPPRSMKELNERSDFINSIPFRGSVNQRLIQREYEQWKNYSFDSPFNEYTLNDISCAEDLMNFHTIDNEPESKPVTTKINRKKTHDYFLRNRIKHG
jgi:hypothetical protein